MSKFRAYYKELMWQVVKIDWFNELVVLADDYGYMTEDISFKEVILMENTEVTDKTGNNIYVGDIIKHDYSDYVCYVVKDRGCFDLQSIYSGANTLRFYVIKKENTLKVIGNIYEHKEMLELE